MRATLTRLATVARTGGNYLQGNTPTGLTGLQTHPTPRPHLIVLYNQTLQKLRQMPEAAVYRQAAEAITKQRLAIIEAAVPEDYEAWKERVGKQMADHPAIFERGGSAQRHRIGDIQYVTSTRPKVVDDRYEEWDGEAVADRVEGPLSEHDRRYQNLDMGDGLPREELQRDTSIELEDEPPLTTNQIQEIEEKIGGGLIEEVVEVAERELKLATEMLDAKPWEELEEKPTQNQWQYFERATHVGNTQGP